VNLNDKQKRMMLELAGLLGRPVRQFGKTGILTDEQGSIFHWRQCPIHNVWLQPEWEPFYHWRCGSHRDNGGRCTFMRPAKMRNRIERHIMYSHKAIAELG